MSDATRPITTLLVANRGEIARRVFRTAREMGMRTVAVFADPDTDAPFVRDADVAVRLPGSTAAETYLDQARILEAARAADADAVHPGYGFLSESAGFAEAVTGAGLTWVGPTPDAIALMGDKVSAKEVATRAGVPTLPSATLEGDDPGLWLAAVEAADVGWPLLVKASAGGGGRGMRLVAGPDELADAVTGARREAAASFGDGTVFAERWLPAPRHIEIQVVADAHGAAVHLGERECSIQRRHQKIVEEAPSGAVTPALRERMGTAALALVDAIGYHGVGTIELLLDESRGRGDDAEFHFLEMNTRLQVEHPVTEEITGLDLVRVQLRVAAGEPLGLTQAEVQLGGHAIEVRVYAEDPAAGWLPSVGTVHCWEPDPTPSIRWESGVESGSVVGPHYDPMLAKVVAHAATRHEAAARLSRALRGLRCEGVTTNLDYLAQVLEDPDFAAGDTPTDFVERHPPTQPDPLPLPHAVALLAARADAARSGSGWSFAPPGWRNGPSTPSAVRLVPTGSGAVDDAGHDLRYRLRAGAASDAIEVEVEGTSGAALRARQRSDGAWVIEDACRSIAVVASVADDGPRATPTRTWWLHSPLGRSTVSEPMRFPDRSVDAVGGGPVAPVPGRVVAVEVVAGDEVEPGATLVVLEAMKVEHRIVAATAAVVAEVLVTPGDNVDAHQLLVRLDSPANEVPDSPTP